MTIQIHVSPSEPAVDDILRLEVAGAADDAVLEARMVDPMGFAWSSSGPLPSPNDDPVSAMEWLWSMTPDTTIPPVVAPGPLAPSTVELAIWSDGRPAATTRVARHRIPPGVVREELDASELVGVLYHPEGKSPGVILLGGSEGGLQETHAALLAAHGFAVLALGYYGLPGLPAVMSRVPLETFARGADWLLAHSAVAGTRVGIYGGSKGGEAALLAASHYGVFGAVVSVAGSGVITNGIGQSISEGDFLDIVGTPTPCFTKQGQDLPFLPNVVTDGLRASVSAGDPVALKRVFQPALSLERRVTEATIPVERIDGPVLLISSTDDTGYGKAYHDIAAHRLVSHTKDFEHVVNTGAGHGIIAPPWSPTTVRQMPGPGVIFLTGGNARADAEARWHNWIKIIRFLQEAPI